MTRFALPPALALLATTALAAPALADVPRVATDVLPVHGLVARVMDGVGMPDLIVPAMASPHGHAMRPSEAAALEGADLLVWMGPSLTPALGRAVEVLADGTARLDLLEVEGAVTRAYGDDHAHDHGDAHGHAEEAADDHGHDEDHDHGHDHAEAEEAGHDHDHDHGHDHGEDHAEEAGHDHDHHHEEAAAAGDHDHGPGDIDPHAWLDPVNAGLWLGAIAEALAAQDPENAAAYRANAEAGRAEIAAAADALAARLAPVADRPFAVFHDAYGYLEARYDLTNAGALRVGDAAAPGAARVSELRARIEADGIGCLFVEPQFDEGLAVTVAEGTGARIATLDPLGSGIEPGPGHYVAFLDAVGTSIAGCFAPS
jgi:zinc transport system substrate-binding protein